MPKQNDGSVISSYFQLKSEDSRDDIKNEGLVFMLGQVEKIHFTDDKSNVSKKVVEYDVSVRDDSGGQSTYRNIRLMSDTYGSNDFQETILEFNEVAFSGKLDISNFFVNKNGTTVVVAHFGGNKDKPFIIGAFPHPAKSGAKRADGIRKLGEYRGVEWNINKDGELIITQRSPRSPSGKLTKNDKVNTEIKLDKEGNVSIKDKESNKIFLDRENKKIKISQSSNGSEINSIELDRESSKLTTKIGTQGLTEIIDGQLDKHTLQTASGLIVEYDGALDKVSYTTAGGPSVTVFGSGSIIVSAGGASMSVDGNTGLIQLSGQLVDVGAAASALAVLGPQLLAWLATHIHIGDGGPVPGLTSPPIIPPPASILSTSVKIKA